MGKKGKSSGPIQTRLMVKECTINENVTVSIGALWLTDLVFEALDLNRFLDSLKRDQGTSFSAIAKGLVAYGMANRGTSLLNLNHLAMDPLMKSLYGLPDGTDYNDLRRAVERMGRARYAIIRHILRMLKGRYRLKLKEIFMDWSSSYIDGKATARIRFGHSKDHRPDRPQVSYGIAVDASTEMPLGMTIERGNSNDSVHFRRTLGLILKYLPKGARVTFDAGANSKVTKDLLVKHELRFLTRDSINASDVKQLDLYRQGWLYLRDGTMAYRYEGNLSYAKVLYYSQKRREETLEGYRRKAARDYDEMLEMSKAIALGRIPRKKYRSSNLFIDTELKLKEEFRGMSREEAIKKAVEARQTGKEGYFILLSSEEGGEQETLDHYRSRNVSEDHYLDLKTGVRIRPLRAKNWEALKGRVFIAYLGLLVVCFARFMTKSLRHQTAETIIDSLRQLSVTVVIENGVEKQRIMSNFNPTVKAIIDAFSVFPAALESLEDSSKGPCGRSGRN